MDVQAILEKEWHYLSVYKNNAITINNTAKPGDDFKTLPRRYTCETAMSGFLINSSEMLTKTLRFFDGKVATIFIDVERKKEINLFKIAKETVKHSRLIALKPNDMTIEACDTLIRNQFQDDLQNKNILVLGTGNLASKISLRLSERQANVFIMGRSLKKEQDVLNGLNLFLPAFSPKIKAFGQWKETSSKVDAIISFISGQFEAEELILPYIDSQTFIVDGGINNFSGSFIKQMMEQSTSITRLDVRIGLPYQFLSTMPYTTTFFEDVYGRSEINGICIVSGGFIGEEGTVIVDNIKQPCQIIGIADGMGGVKKIENQTDPDRKSIQTIQETISISM